MLPDQLTQAIVLLLRMVHTPFVMRATKLLSRGFVCARPETQPRVVVQMLLKNSAAHHLKTFPDVLIPFRCMHTRRQLRPQQSLLDPYT